MALTKRETQIIKLLCLGYASKDISKKINISPRTVETYIERIMYKLRARNRLALVAIYIREYEKI